MRLDEASTARLDAIVEGRVALESYEHFLARTATDDADYLFAEARARFEVRDADVLRAPPTLVVSERGQGVEISSAGAAGKVAIAGLSRPRAERLLSRIDGQLSYAELCRFAGDDRVAFESLVERALGSLLFTPAAVAGLELRISGAELVRFVGTPYELVRSYWENMADVREAAEDWLPGCREPNAFRHTLQRLHVLTLLGAGLSNFYRPASKISHLGVRPGALYEAETQIVETAAGARFVSGPRVGVALIGGEHYHALLYAEDPAALAPTRVLRDERGLDWGRVVTGRAASDENDAAWFCPPRPLRSEHWEQLFSAYSAASAEATSPARTIEQLARFHHRFVRLHPFRCANQSLAMNLTNRVLARSHGAGIPHLLLDQLALRLTEPAYARVFARAVEGHVVRGSPVERWAALRQRKLEAYALIEQLKTARDLKSARELARANPSAARWALLEPNAAPL